jgi:DNA-binding IclR family transcriptional regulator
MGYLSPLDSKDRPMTDHPKNHEQYLVPGLVRGLELLQAFSHDNPTMRLSDLAVELGVSRSSAFRLAYTLESLGFLDRDSNGTTYRLTSKVLSLGFAYLGSFELIDVARPILEKLRDKTHLSAHLAVLEGDKIVHLIRLASKTAMTSNIAVGSRRPAHATPLGRALLMDSTLERLRSIFGAGPLEVFTDQTPTDIKELHGLLVDDTKRGFIVSRGSFMPSGSSVAAPVRGWEAEILAAINVSGPQESFDDGGVVKQIQKDVIAAAAEISASLGYAPARLKARTRHPAMSE